MQFINYFLASLVSFSGLFVGMFLAFYTKEELKQGKKYFVIIEKLLLSLVLFFFLFFYELDMITILVISLLFFVIILVLKFDNYPIVYIALAIIFYLTQDNNIFPLISSLIFLYGLPVGTLIAYKMKNKKNDIFKFLLKKYSLFVIIALLLYLIF